MAELEPGPVRGLSEISQMFRRARVYPLSVLGLALLIGAIVVGIKLVSEHVFAPRYVMRVVEADRDASSLPIMKRQLKEYVMGAVFSNAALERVRAKHGLYPGLARANRQAALESFREDIGVEVYRNYFVEQRYDGDDPRSARIAISYRSEDRALALAVTRDLGELVMLHEQATRKAQSADAAERARIALERTSKRYVEQKRQISERALAPREQQIQARVEQAGLAHALQTLERDAEIAEQRSATLEIGKRMEAENLGLVFETVDRGEIPRSAEIEARDLLLLGTIGFLFGLPLAGMLVGAFSRTIVSIDDLQDLPVPVIGEVRDLRLNRSAR